MNTNAIVFCGTGSMTVYIHIYIYIYISVATLAQDISVRSTEHAFSFSNLLLQT